MGLRGGWKFSVPLNEPHCMVTVIYDYYDGIFIIRYSGINSCSFSSECVSILW